MKNKSTQELLKLVAENPELPLKFFTNWQVCCEDHGYWMGEIETVEVCEIVTYTNMFGNTSTYFSKQEFMDADEDDENRENNYNEAEKEKAIVIFIGI